jgi:hypothetical protein
MKQSTKAEFTLEIDGAVGLVASSIWASCEIPLRCSSGAAAWQVYFLLVICLGEAQKTRKKQYDEQKFCLFLWHRDFGASNERQYMDLLQGDT